MRPFVLIVLLVISGCVTTTQLDEKSFSDSENRCLTRGGCWKIPLLAVTANTPEDAREFMFSGWLTIDQRLNAGEPRFLSVESMQGQQLCKGGYRWDGWGWSSDVIVKCFSEKISGAGKFYSKGKQTSGPYVGKSMGTGVVEFSDGTLFLVIYGLLPSEAASDNFLELWNKYGGKNLGNVTITPSRLAPSPLREETAFLQQPPAQQVAR